jgi:hypothetical protein
MKASRLLLALMIAGAVPAAARESANPAGRVVRVIGTDVTSITPASATAGGQNASLPSVLFNPVPLPAGAVPLDSTWYDLQDMGSLGNRIVVGADDRVHVVYQKDFCELGGGCPPNLSAAQPYPNRAMAYAARSVSGVWDMRGKVQDPRLWNCCLTEKLGGFGTVALAPDGRVSIAQHMNEDGCDLRGAMYIQDSPNASTYAGNLTPIVSPSYLFPQIAANVNGSFTLMGEVPKGGQYDEVNDFRVSYLAATGAAFVCPTGWQMGTWTAVAPTSLFRDGKPAFPSMASASDGRVGIAVGDFGGNVYLIESSNGTFAPATIRIRPLTSYTDAQVTAPDSTSTQYRAYIHCHVAYNDTTPNVVWSELQARKVGSSVEFFDWRSRIMHWSSKRGTSVVKQVAAGEADRYDDVELGLSGPLPGFNTLAVDWPQVGFSTDGSETYVAWLRFTDAQVDPTADAGLPGIVTGIGFGDICISLTHNNDPWAAPVNLTNTPTTDERFFSLAARNLGGKAHLVFEASATNQAGVVIIGDRGTTPGNILRRIAYLEAPIPGSTVDVPSGTSPLRAALRVQPNPARGSVRFSLGRWFAPGERVEVMGVDGRVMARVEPDANGFLRWDGRDPSGRLAPSGVYFARVAGDPEARAVRFTILR